MTDPDIVDNFFGVYLLYNLNPKFKGRTYIGYTRDPNRRIMQHNRGTWAGGANRTNNKGPWKMVLVVHGFPNNISALRFEWAWQNPNRTTRLQHLDLKKIPRKETEFQFKLRVLSEMLRVGPWCRLPLSIRWLEQEYYEEFSADKLPPCHMTTCYGPVKSRNVRVALDVEKVSEKCHLCKEYISDKSIKCINDKCNLVAHITCLADVFLTPGEYIPVEGGCPSCKIKVKWGDLVQKMKGYQFTEENADNNTDDANEIDNDIVCTQDRTFVDNNSWFLDCNEDL